MGSDQHFHANVDLTPFILLAAHIFSMLGFATYAALLPELRDTWALSNAQAGVIGGMFFAGYVATVSYWTALTDRIDGRKVYLAGSLIATAAGVGFGVAANGFASAVFFQILLGAGVAATYMPGLRLLSDHVSGPYQSRYIAFYTSFFGVGTALSFALAGAIAPLAGWRAAFVISAAGPVVSGVLVFGFIKLGGRALVRGKGFSLKALFPLSAWRKVLMNRSAAGYTLGYTAHCLELFGSRSWMVAFLAFSSGLHSQASFPWPAAAIAALVNLIAVPASIIGNEIALRFGRQRWIVIAMGASGSCGVLLGFSASWHWAVVLALLVIYSMLVMAESATLTAGLIATAPPELRGAAMGLYSLLGFGGGMLGPVVFGAALDAAGGANSTLAWAIGYGAVGAGCLAAPIVARVFGRGVESSRHLS